MPRELKIRTGVKVDTAGLRRHLAVWSVAMGKTAQETVRQQAGLLAQDMLNYTLPLDGQPGKRRGESLAARNKGIESVERDVDRIFKPFEKASYSDIANNNDYGVFAEYAAARRKANLPIPDYVVRGLDGYFDAGKAWMRFRSAYGYGKGARKSGKAYFKTMKGDGMMDAQIERRGGTNVDDYAKNVVKSKDVYFTEQGRIDKHKREMASHVGRLKSAWLMVGWRLGRKMRAPPWIAAHVGNGDDILIDNSSDKEKPTVWIGNAVQGKMTKSPGRDLWKTALNHRAYSMRVDIDQRLRKALRGSKGGFLGMANALGLYEEPKED